LNINERCYKKKSPEAIAYETTTAHYFLFYDKDLDYVLQHNEAQAVIEIELAAIAMTKMYQEDAARQMKGYVS